MSLGARYMLLSVVFFSFGHAAVKWLPHIPFYQLVFLRALITALICLGMIFWHRISLKGSDPGLLIMRGMAGTIALTCYFYSLQNMPLASAVTIQYLSPILTLLIAHLMLKEKATRLQAVCFVMAFIGVLFVKGFDPRVTHFALAISLVSVVASAFAYNFVRMLRKSDHELVVVLYFTLITIPLVGPFALYSWVWPAATDWIYILALGVLTQLAQLYMTKAYQRETAANVAILNNLSIVFALGIGFYFFNEAFSVWSLVGIVAILLAVFVGQVKGRQAKVAAKDREPRSPNGVR